ncbi:peptidoglycan D,D-transpeptidase FtsI family protein [Bacillus sp. FJAT-27225]|uniref:peptidoglycan D,D-transpeptidase FtsI family protein n=1 Tax=Bacillus sp. FJAT-27225 TaxID=1743144 RepID=UPI000AFDEF13|nr:penicillin-binding protein 2 [Bacillus sp. FJAT-27225]
MVSKKKKKRFVPLRLNLLFLAIFFLFSMLIVRLGIVQIVYGDDFKREVERTEDVTVKYPVPRGKMYDRNQKVIVDNTPLNAIIYTKYQNTKPEEMLETARKLAKLIEKKPGKIPEWELIDYWLLTNPKKAKNKITKQEWKLYYKKDLKEKDIYRLQVERVTKEELETITNNPAEMEVLAIYRKFKSGYAQSPQIVKSGKKQRDPEDDKDIEIVTDEEFAAVSENLEDLPGVDTTTDWKRKYVFSNTLRSILGNVSNDEKGIPKEKLDYYLSRGYSRNDRVGTSYIEQQYENILRGQKAKVKNETDKAGSIIKSETVSEGKRGKDIVLTIDMELQKAVEKIIEDQLWAGKRSGSSPLLDRAFVVLTDPHTGEILTMAGKKIERNKDTGEYEIGDYALGTFTTSYSVGSAVKGATIYSGFKEGVIKPGSRFFDTAMVIRGTDEKSSHRAGIGWTDNVRALELSSNVYMFYIAIKIGGGYYERNQPLTINLNGFNKMRSAFGQFGLGTRTGIDLPGEAAGFPGPLEGGKLLDLAIGQYDTYTPMQLAQYVSTIANGGKRVQLHILKEIREPELDNKELGPILEEFQPKVLNKLDGSQVWLDQIHKGFWRVMHGAEGTATKTFSKTAYNPAGKTGTAEAFYDGFERKKFGKIPPEVMNLSLVSYAPAGPGQKPEVAMSVVVPWAYSGSRGPGYNSTIGKAVLDTYFELKEKRMKESQQVDNNTETP